VVFFMSARIDSMRAQTASTLFWVYAGLMGASLASVFLVFTGASVARVFFITAAAFAGLSLYGYTTKKDLSGFGSFLIMGVWGLLIAGIVNIFLASPMLHFVMSAAGVLIFAGLTAYDTQNIKQMYWEGDHSEVAAKKAVFGALQLYMDFINLFMFLLQFMGVRRDE
jgi:FtsH-binding integral membrane protein